MSNVPQVTFQTVSSSRPIIDCVYGDHVMVVDSTAETVGELRTRMERLKNPIENDLAKRKDSGVVTVVNLSWAPDKVTSIPPSLTISFGMELSGAFAILFNQSAHAIRRGRWAVVTSRGTAIILSGIRAEQRPANPADFPPCVLDGMTHHEAEEYARDANEPRFAMARIPRQWTISLRRADCVEESQASEKGGAR